MGQGLGEHDARAVWVGPGSQHWCLSRDEPHGVPVACGGLA